jgi:hypothetical protein
MSKVGRRCLRCLFIIWCLLNLLIRNDLLLGKGCNRLILGIVALPEK